MTYNEFKERVVSEVRDSLPEGNDLVLSEVNKVNVVEDAITLKGVGVSPTLYLREQYQRLVAGVSLEEIAGDLIRLLLETPTKTLPEVNKESVLKGVVPEVVNRELNQEFLKKVLYREFLDLAIVYRVILREGDETFSMVVTSSCARSFGLSEEEIFEQAVRNARERVVVQSIASVLREFCPEFECEVVPMYVVRYRGGLFGAGSMVLKDVFMTLSKELGEKFYVIPSSRHEVIAVPYYDCEDLNTMVRQVNQEQLESVDVLSDHVYLFDGEMKCND